MVYQLMYYSTACNEPSDGELLKILETSRINNKRSDITGLLLYGGGVFFQVLEGAKSEVQDCYARIEHDNRHHSLLLLVERDVAARNFDQWAMAYTPINREVNQGIESLVRLDRQGVNAGTTKDCDPFVSMLTQSFLSNQRLV